MYIWQATSQSNTFHFFHLPDFQVITTILKGSPHSTFRYYQAFSPVLPLFHFLVGDSLSPVLLMMSQAWVLAVVLALCIPVFWRYSWLSSQVILFYL